MNNKIKKIDKFKKIATYAILIFFALINIYPIFWMVMNSFKTENQISINSFSLPESFMLSNYTKAWNAVSLGRSFMNSFIVAGISVLITVAIGSLAAYFISRFEFPGKKLIYSFFIFGLLVPIHGTLVPIFILMRNIGLVNTRVSLILPYVAFNLPLTIFILSSFMKSLPKAVEEAAIVDGAGYLRIFWSIILPMSRPALATVGILNFVYNWNEFSFALVLINDNKLMTLPLSLSLFSGQFSTDYGMQMAGLSMALVPIIAIYLLMEDQLVKGMSAGAVKG
ncbi:carbohydrate ABC transporter membrane protein 2 (CUT1 family) [Halanaerobium saccharolyticum]|uniref:Carbohydrate ABC transporter membrane protein 2 (CUT1 family) n=1 Tax=Halanaerobium saccharolyticum TaxID=43595 RepID=A0A4V3CFL0_9FIRM|nr:carbohydrate ABC transporter permease [Halanaerobium saccharolyticum]TDO94222.1 carbohydrate ABC transporter membrane protein 2 (CUT1 family) [Halanaerobium saccharolyticum]